MYLRVFSACPGRPSLAGLAWLEDPHFPGFMFRQNRKRRNDIKTNTPDPHFPEITLQKTKTRQTPIIQKTRPRPPPPKRVRGQCTPPKSLPL